MTVLIVAALCLIIIPSIYFVAEAITLHRKKRQK